MTKNIIIAIAILSLGIAACCDKEPIPVVPVSPLVRTDNSGNLLNPADSSNIRMIPLPDISNLPNSQWIQMLGFVPRVSNASHLDLYFYPNPTPKLSSPILKIHSDNKPINYIFLAQGDYPLGRIDGGTSLDSATFITSTDVYLAIPTNGAPQESSNYGFLVVTTDSCIYSTAAYLERY